MLVRKTLLGFYCLLSALVLNGQIVKNGSMDGPAGTVTTPDSWFSCLTTSTVDMQPGLWGVTRSAQEGSTFIDMVCRGNFNANANTCEELAQTLNQTLEAGKCYRLDLYLAYVPDFLIPEFRNPIDLRISAGVNDCSRDLELAYYPAIDHEEWRQYTSYFSPDQDLNSLWLEAQYSHSPNYFGHMLIDNVSIEEVTDPPVQELLLCEGETLGLTAFDTENALGYAWSNGAASPGINVTEGGTYSVDITLGNCVVTETFEVNLQEAPTPVLTTDFNICPGEEIVLDATTANATYRWLDGSEEPTFTASAQGSYLVNITVGTCTTQLTIELLSNDCIGEIEMPNAFTPNSDGKNDRLTPILVRNMASMRTVVYNRWGTSVFDTTDTMIQWDGLLPNGNPAPEATYYWRLVYTDFAGNQGDLKGTVSLIR